jgi:hypothetical protein
MLLMLRFAGALSTCLSNAQLTQDVRWQPFEPAERLPNPTIPDVDAFTSVLARSDSLDYFVGRDLGLYPSQTLGGDSLAAYTGELGQLTPSSRGIVIDAPPDQALMAPGLNSPAPVDNGTYPGEIRIDFGSPPPVPPRPPSPPLAPPPSAAQTQPLPPLPAPPPQTTPFTSAPAPAPVLPASPAPPFSSWG